MGAQVGASLCSHQGSGQVNGREYLSLLHELNCVVCANCYGKNRPATDAHHLESIRGNHSDFAAVPLCRDCHVELHAASRRAFYRSHKLDEIKLLAWTIEQAINHD